MKILITGANGFIGKHVTKQLATVNNTILATGFEKNKSDNSQDNVKWIYGNLSNLDNYKAEIREFNPDVTVHMAWQGIPDFSENISRLNLETSIDLLDFIIEETDCSKIIVSGSCFEYGKRNGVVKESENTAINSYFSWAKHSIYGYLELKCKQKYIELVWFRYFYVYGPGQRKASLIPTILDSFKNNLTPDIRNPYNKNDFIYVQDIATATDCVINLETKIDSGIYNLGSGYSTSVLEICVKAELAVTGVQKATKSLAKIPKIDFQDFWADVSKLKSLGWKPMYSIEKGVNEMIKNLKKEQ